jgi:hypothetical protein
MSVIIKDSEKKIFDDRAKLDNRWEEFFKSTVAKHGLIGAYYTTTKMGHYFCTYVILNEQPKTFMGYIRKIHTLAEVIGPFDFDRFNYSRENNKIEITIKDYAYEKQINEIAKDLESWKEYVYGNKYHRKVYIL